jgi:hypothetical protein
MSFIVYLAWALWLLPSFRAAEAALGITGSNNHRNLQEVPRFGITVDSLTPLTVQQVNTVQSVAEAAIAKYVASVYKVAPSSAGLQVLESALGIPDGENTRQFASSTIGDANGSVRRLSTFQCTGSYCSVIGCRNCIRRSGSTGFSASASMASISSGGGCYPQLTDVENSVEATLRSMDPVAYAAVQVTIMQIPSGTAVDELSSGDAC